MSRMQDWRRQPIPDGPYEGLKRKDMLFREYAASLLRGAELNVDELWKLLPKYNRNKVSAWRKGWRDWPLGTIGEAGKPYQCSNGVLVPELSRDVADRAREELRGKEYNPPVSTERMSLKLADHEAQETGADDDSPYAAKEGDYRELITRQIRERRGQQRFREALRRRYGDRCLVTGCAVVAVLEAAHINPYRGPNDQNPTNGLLLRSDIHTLFDLDLLGIEPDTLRVVIAPALSDDPQYRALVDRKLRCPPDRQPSKPALSLRYEHFRQRIQQLQTSRDRDSGASG